MNSQVIYMDILNTILDKIVNGNYSISIKEIKPEEEKVIAKEQSVESFHMYEGEKLVIRFTDGTEETIYLEEVGSIRLNEFEIFLRADIVAHMFAFEEEEYEISLWSKNNWELKIIHHV